MEPIPYDAFSTHIWLVGGVRFELTKPEATVLQTARFEPLAYPPIRDAHLSLFALTRIIL